MLALRKGFGYNRFSLTNSKWMTMKKLLLIVLSAMFITACSTGAHKDDLAKYRDKTSRQLYTGAENSMKDGEYSEAIKQFEALDAIYPFGAYSRQAQLDIIYAYFKNDDQLSATVAADRYIHLYPQGPDVDYAYYMKGIVDYRQGMTWLQKLMGSDPSERDMSHLTSAYAAFNQLVERFPRSQYRDSSVLHMRYIRNMIAKHYLDTGIYYYKRKAYVASINRAMTVVQHFQGAPQVIGALALAVKSYRKLDMTKQADMYYNLLAKNYPNSKALQELNNV